MSGGSVPAAATDAVVQKPDSTKTVDEPKITPALSSEQLRAQATKAFTNDHLESAIELYSKALQAKV
jgi:hypothetical protein